MVHACLNCLYFSGRITYYTHPPEDQSRQAIVSSEIVSSMSKEFDIDALLADEQEALQGTRLYGVLREY